MQKHQQVVVLLSIVPWVEALLAMIVHSIVYFVYHLQIPLIVAHLLVFAANCVIVILLYQFLHDNDKYRIAMRQIRIKYILLSINAIILVQSAGTFASIVTNELHMRFRTLPSMQTRQGYSGPWYQMVFFVGIVAYVASSLLVFPISVLLQFILCLILWIRDIKKIAIENKPVEDMDIAEMEGSVPREAVVLPMDQENERDQMQAASLVRTVQE